MQSTLDDELFPRIAAVVTSHEAWETLKKEFLGEKKVLTIKLQTLRREFETLAMKEKECVQDFLSRVSGVVSQMKIYGENISNETIVSKALRSLTKDFDHAVDAIDESSGLSKYSSDELMGSLVAMRSESTGPVKRWRRRVYKSKQSILTEENQQTLVARRRQRGLSWPKSRKKSIW